MMKMDILKNQGGMALVIALVMLLVLTIIGINAITTTTFETSISGNQRIYNTAFYGADGGIEDFRARAPGNVEIINGFITIPPQTITGSPFNVTYNVTYQGPGIFSTVNYGGVTYQPFRVTSEGVATNFPTAGRVQVETIIEIYTGGSGSVAEAKKYN